MGRDADISQEADRQAFSEPPSNGIMLAMLAVVAFVMVGIVFAAAWYERGRAHPAVASTKAAVRVTTGIANPPAAPSQPRIVGTPITINPSHSKQPK